VRRRHLLLTAVVMLVAVWTGVRVARSVQDARMRTDRTVDYVCSSSLRAVGTALEHYRSEHEGAWPHSVDDLVPDYLKHTGDCAREEVGGKHCQYTPPADDAPDAAVVIRCTRTPGVVAVLRKDMKVVVESRDGG
jgi:hypothetical protein